MRRRPIALAAVAIVLVVGGCSSTPRAGTASIASSGPVGTASETAVGVITITSADVPMPAPQSVTPAAGTPMRIVSLATGVGETLAALGVADRVVGRDETSDVPQIDAAEVVTRAHAVSAEKVLSLDPDLVLVDASTSPPEALTQIRDAGIRVVQVPEAWSVGDIAARTHAVAAAAGVPVEAADRVIAEAARTSTPPSAASSTTRPRVAFLYLRGTAAIYLVGGVGSGADALIDAAGGVDAGAAAGYQGFIPLTAEAVASLDPDVILVMTKGLQSVGGVDGLVGLPGVAQTKAGRSRSVIAVDDTLLLSFGPRTGALIDALHTALAAESA